MMVDMRGATRQTLAFLEHLETPQYVFSALSVPGAWL